MEFIKNDYTRCKHNYRNYRYNNVRLLRIASMESTIYQILE